MGKPGGIGVILAAIAIAQKVGNYENKPLAVIIAIAAGVALICWMIEAVVNGRERLRRAKVSGGKTLKIKAQFWAYALLGCAIASAVAWPIIASGHKEQARQEPPPKQADGGQPRVAPEPLPQTPPTPKNKAKENVAATKKETAPGGSSTGSVGTLTQGPCSVAQVGGSNNQGTANCVPIAFRVITEPQKRAIQAFIATLPASVMISVGGVYGSGDAVNYAQLFLPLFDGRHLDNQQSASIRTGFPTTFINIFISTVSEEDSAVQYRNSFVDVLNGIGIPANRANGSKISPGNLEFLVGFRPEEVKPQQ